VKATNYQRRGLKLFVKSPQDNVDLAVLRLLHAVETIANQGLNNESLLGRSLSDANLQCRMATASLIFRSSSGQKRGLRPSKQITLLDESTRSVISAGVVGKHKMLSSGIGHRCRHLE
jgi:hypothetical protein